MSRDQFSQGGRLEEARAEQPPQSFRLQQIRHLAAGKDAPKRFVMGHPEKCERRDQRSGAGARHECELRPRSACGPSGQKTGAKRTVGAPAGQRQNGRLLHWNPGHDRAPPRRDGRVIGPQAGARNA